MLQKVIVVLVGLVMSLVGALSPEGLFASAPGDVLAPAAKQAEQTLATVRSADGLAFAKVSVLWAEVDGRRVTEDAWGTGEVKELRFKVGVKEIEGAQLAVGEKLVPLKPTDIVTIRLFRGDFSYRGMGTSAASIQLQGTVQTTTLNEGGPTGKLRTEAAGVAGSAPATGLQRVAYVVLSTGEAIDTVAMQSGGARLFTEGTEPTDAQGRPGNLLAKWVKIDGKVVREYTWGDATVGTIEFEPAEVDGPVTLSFQGVPTTPTPGSRVVVKDFVGEYLVYQVPGGLLRLRLDGYAAETTVGQTGGVPILSGPGAPIPAFDIVPENPRTTDVVSIKDRSTDDGVVVFWRWDFGDGVASALQDPTHRFTRPGAYNVTLVVTDDDLKTSEVSRIVVVRNADPVAGFEWLPRIVTTDSLVAFTDLSLDPDGVIANWTWDFGDGQRSHARAPTHQYARSGTFSVTLTVVDDLGGRATATKDVVVRNHPPVASFEWGPVNPYTNVPVTFTSRSVDRDGTIVSYAWDFDGEPGAEAEGQVVAHTFRTPGRHVVTLTVEDDGDSTDTVYVELNIENTPPIAWFTYGPANITVDTEVLFNNEATDTDGFIVYSDWTWGDGSTTRLVTGNTERDVNKAQENAGYDVSVPTPPQARHRFPSAGTYDVTLCVMDNRAGEDCVTRSVTVNQSVPRADLRVTPSFPIFRNTIVTFDSTGSRDPDGDPIVYRKIEFGDGQFVEDEGVAQHVYTQLGPYRVNLTVRDSNGLANTMFRTINVLNAPPSGRIVANVANLYSGHPVTFSVADLTDIDGDLEDIRYEWSFGLSGGTSTEAAPTRTFRTEGAAELLVRLRLLDAEGGRSQEIRRSFTIEVAQPEPSFSMSDDTPTKDQPITFTDTSETANGEITRWEWKIDEVIVSTERSFEHTFTDGSQHTVTLSVGDDVAPGMVSTSRNLDINLAPTAVVNLLTGGSLRPEQAVRFRDASSDPDGNANIVRRSWDFGDGTTMDVTQTEVEHTYALPGPFLVTLTVEDAAGAIDTGTLTVTIQGRRPVAAWHIVESAPHSRGEALTFVSDSTHPDGTPITEFIWNFGDGTLLEGDASPTHAFAYSGMYYVTLTVGDGALRSAPAGQYVYVGSDAPLTVDISALLPHGGQADLMDPDVEILVDHGPRTGGSFVYRKSSLSPVPGAPDHLLLVLPAGTWGGEDSLTVYLQDRSYMAKPAFRSLRLSDGSPTLNVVFELPLPLDVEVEAISEYRPEVFRRHLLTGTEPVIYDLSSPFHGEGRVAYRDGVVARNAEVIVQLRYVPGQLPVGGTSLRDLAGRSSAVNNNDHLGWCTADEVRTNDLGRFTWQADEGSDCTFSRGEVHGFGRWQVRAIARQSFAPNGVSEPADFYVDPVGLFATSYLP